MTTTWKKVFPVFKECKLSDIRLSVTSFLSARPEIFEGAVADVSEDPPRVIIRERESTEEKPIDFSWAKSLELVEVSSGWKLTASFHGGAWIVFSTPGLE